MDLITVVSDAQFSACGRYRHTLRRMWLKEFTDPRYMQPGYLLWIMLNPSKGGAGEDDATVRRCMQFTARERYTQLYIVNLYDFIATDPQALRKETHPVSEGYFERFVEPLARRADFAICGWGNNADTAHALLIARQLERRNVGLFSLGVTKSGHPRHPLYLHASTDLEPWRSIHLTGK